MLVAEVVKVGKEKVRDSLQSGGHGEKVTQLLGGDTSVSKKEQ